MNRLAIVPFLALLAFASLVPNSASAHCEVPCGIFDDSVRFSSLAEDVTTIDRAMKEIAALSAAAEKNYNQIVRWVTTKEDHAQKIIDICSQYFLAQRIKPVEATDTAFQSYQNKLTLVHQIILAAVKCKQTTDPAHPARVRELVDRFRTAYYGEHGHAH